MSVQDQYFHVLFLSFFQQYLYLVNYMKTSTEEQINKSKSSPKCSKGHDATMVCFSQCCLNRAFICSDETCSCRAPHRFCFQISVKSVLKIIQAHSYSLKPLQEQIETLFNDAIDNLSDEKDRIISMIQSDPQFHYLGLNRHQQIFLDVIQNGSNPDQIDCRFVWTLQNQSKGDNKTHQAIQKLKLQVDMIGENLKKQLYIFNDDLKEFFEQVKEQVLSRNEFFRKSKIIKTTQDTKKLLDYLEGKNVKLTKLLYRASENKFLVKKWHQKCSQIPSTLTIVQTEFGKVIGGFLSFAWPAPGEGSWQLSPSRFSDCFLFSLTDNHKLKGPQNSYLSNCMVFFSKDEKLGPTFGANKDLYIADKANQNTNSSANPGNTFKNEKYKCQDQESQVSFAGGHQFKVKQWQVWQIKFDIQGLFWL